MHTVQPFIYFQANHTVQTRHSGTHVRPSSHIGHTDCNRSFYIQNTIPNLVESSNLVLPLIWRHVQSRFSRHRMHSLLMCRQHGCSCTGGLRRLFLRTKITEVLPLAADLPLALVILQGGTGFPLVVVLGPIHAFVLGFS